MRGTRCVMTDFRVTMRRADLDDAEARRRLAEAYEVILEACRKGQRQVTVERVKDSNGRGEARGGSVKVDTK